MKSISKKKLTQDMYSYIKDNQAVNLDSVDIIEEFNKYDPALVLDVLGDLQSLHHIKRVHSYGVQYKYITNT